MKTLGAIFFSILAGSCFSQALVYPRIGATLSNTSATETDGIDQVSKVGFSVGAGFEFKLNDTFSLQPELNFTQKGFGFNAEESDQTFFISIENKTRIDYLEVPVFAKIYLGPTAKVYLLAGPSVAVGIGGQAKTKVTTDLFGTPFNVTVKGKVKFGEPPVSYNPEEDTEIYFDNRVDFGLQGGLGVIVYRQAAVELRYNYGLSDLMDEEDSKNRVIHINIVVPLNSFKKAAK
jgi:opacity protein-like surface antigen